MSHDSAAKDELMNLLKTTPIGGEYSFEYQGSEYRARKYIQAMRAHLTRFRQKVMLQGKRPRHFKLNVVKLEPRVVAPEQTVCSVTIRRTTSDSNVLNDLADVLTEVALTSGDE